MFGTLHWNSQNEEAEFVERLHGSSNPEKTSACDRCKARKVKCNTNKNGCSRCKRLGKRCTFTFIKQRGHQRLRKASVNIAHQECMLDLLIQPSTSSSSKDTRHEEGAHSNKWPLVTSFSADGNIDNNEQGQLLEESLADILADIPANFDLSLVPEFGQQTSDQDADNIFNFTLSQLPCFSTILPSTHPQLIQPAAVKTSENISSPPLNSGDEIPLYFSPTVLDFAISIYDSPDKRSQDSSLFEIGSNATPTSLHTPTLVSTAFSSPIPSALSCQCLAAVGFAVEEFEASCNSGNRAELDSIVANQKEAIKCCRSMLKCGYCMAKRENLVLLVIVTEKIIATCGRIVALYRMKDGDTRAGSVPASLLGCLPTGRLSHRVHVEDVDSSTRESDWRELHLGDYEISSPLEWEHLVRVLILFQLRAVMELLVDMKNMGSSILGETLTASLVQAEVRIGELEKDIYII